MKEKEIITLIKISKVKPLRKKLPLLARNFKPLSELLEKKKEELLQYFSQELVELILKAKTLPYEVELKKLKNLQAKVISWEDEEYPTKLKEISTPPPFLYVRGELTQEDRTSVAIVGSRLASYYGKQVAYKLAYHLALNGVTIVSGLARGIDTYAHKGALDAGGRTIGVLGCGIDYIYPKGNEPLMHRILQNGACLTEFPIGEIPLPYNFPFRNRLISGLSLGVIVVEARLKSGTFSTVRWALEQGREVFAVPGNIDSEPSKGVNKLIQEGATLITSAEDVLYCLI